MIGRLANSLVDLILPPCCLVCGAPGPTDPERLCARCAHILQGERQRPTCPRCASDVADYEVADGHCRQCRRQSPSVNGTARAGAYRDGLGFLLRAFKFHRQELFAPLLAGWVADAIVRADWRADIEAVVPVPAYWTRRIGRPYHAATCIAEIVAARLGVPHIPMLRRLRGGPHQVGLSYTKRWENVKGAFALRHGYRLRDAKILVVDDVRTTGATLAECSKVLRRAGASHVYAAVVVSAGDPRLNV